MKVSRNAPCQCGSGKKYKKCCLQQEKEQRRVQPERNTTTTTPPEETIPLQRMLKNSEQELSTEFSTGLTLIPTPMSVGLTPDIVLRLQQGERELALSLAEQAESDPDEFLQVLSWLAYFGHLGLSVEARRKAWADTGYKDALQSWQSERFLETTFTLELLEYSQECPEGEFSINDAKVLNRLRNYVEEPEREVDLETLETSFLHLLGQSHTPWQKKDFTFKNRRERLSMIWDNYSDENIDDGEGIGFQLAEDPARKRWMALTFEFLHDLHQIENVSWTKAELARQCLERYILARADGNLKHRSDAESLSPFSAQKMENHKPKKNKKKIKPHKLCPDQTTLERFLADRFGRFSGFLHLRAFAMLEYLPAWLDFLLSKQLIEEHHRDRTMRDLSEIGRKTTQFASTYFQPLPEIVEHFQEWYAKHWG